MNPPPPAADNRAPDLQTGAGISSELRFATARLGCLLPILGFGALFFAIGAARPGFLDRGRGLPAEWFNSVQVGGIAILWFLPAAGMFWAFLRFGWRWADGTAVSASEAGLRFHPTIRRRPVRWEELRNVQFVTHHQGPADYRELVFVLRTCVVRVRGVEKEAAEAFVAALRARPT